MAPAPEPEPEPEPKPKPKPRSKKPRAPRPKPEPTPEPAIGELPPRMVAIAYVLAVVCLVAPLAVLGAGFAGAVLLRRGRASAGLGVIAVAVLCAVLGVLLRS